MARYRFDRFVLDEKERRLSRDGAPVELNARYLDALALLVRSGGGLVAKERFMAEVWRGVPVTDEALTQAVRTLRRALGDDAASPRFIETVPKHGYRFIAAVADGEPRSGARPSVAQIGLAGTAGGIAAGLIGGLIYGAVLAAGADGSRGSVLLVLTSITMLVATLGAAGVSFGIGVADAAAGRPGWWRIAGGAGGGLVVGACTKLLGDQAAALLLGRAPTGITGAGEGLVLGGAIGLAAALAIGLSPRRAAAVAAAIGAGGGAAITLGGGRLLAGSLALLAAVFPGSRLRMDAIGGLFGEAGIGPVAAAVTGALEGALFAGCVVGALIWVASKPSPLVEEG